MADTLLAKLGLNTKDFSSGLAKAEGKLKAFGDVAKGVFGALGVGIGLAGLKKYIDSLDELGKRAKDFTFTADGFKWLQEQAGFAGVKVEALDDGLKTLKKAIGDAMTGAGSQAEAFKKLGVTIQRADGTYKDFKEVLVDVSAGFNNLGESADKSKIAEDLLGGSGVKVVRVLQEQAPAIADNIGKFGDYSKAAEIAARTNDRISEIYNRATRRATVGLANFDRLMSSLAYLKRANWSLMDAYSMVEASEREMAKNEQAISKYKNEQAIAEQKRTDALKRLDKLDELDKKLADFRRGEMSDTYKVIKLQSDIASIKKDLLTLDEDSADYLAKYTRLTEQTIALEKTLAKIKKEKDAAAIKKIEAERRKNDEEKKRIEAEREKNLKEKISAETELQRLYKERAQITKDIADNAKRATDEMLKLVAEKGSGQVKSKANRAEDYTKKAEQARAEGRWSDYSRYTDRAEKARAEAVAKRKSSLESAGREALYRGDTARFGRLQEAYKNEGFAQKPTDDQAERIKNIDANIKTTAEKLTTLVDGLTNKD